MIIGSFVDHQPFKHHAKGKAHGQSADTDSADKDNTPSPPPLMTSRQAVDSAQALLNFALSTSGPAMVDWPPDGKRSSDHRPLALTVPVAAVTWPWALLTSPRPTDRGHRGL